MNKLNFILVLLLLSKVSLAQLQISPQVLFANKKIQLAGKYLGKTLPKIVYKKDTSLCDQCYQTTQDEIKNTVTIKAGGDNGLMYGGLEIAERMQLSQKLTGLGNAKGKPFLEKRGIKFNIPLDLRTPSYSDNSDAFQKNIPEVWDINFWKQYLDDMAVNRYNVLSLWSLQPFPSIVKVPEFPDVALNDVWRTKAKLDDKYSGNGKDLGKKELFDSIEVVKKITIDEKIKFWQEVMQYAHDRGVAVYWFTWNTFVYGAEGKHGITKGNTNDTTIAYFRAAVRQTIKTYPLLAGIGITAGEYMENRKDENSNEKWLWKTYGEGIRDGLKETPNRDFTLIHRFHWASLGEIKDAFKNLPCKLEVSLKYAVAHMYAITEPPFVRPAMPWLSQQTKTWLTIRNDDIYSFRWGNINFARQFVKNIPSPEKVAGYYMGADGYCLGVDYLSRYKTSEKQSVIQKQWYMMMLWGRLTYDPTLKDELFTQTVNQRFPQTPIKPLLKAWESSSMVFPWITRFIWGDIDMKWFPEANVSHPTVKGFYTVKDFVERAPMPGSHIQNIVTWSKNFLNNQKDTLISPIQVADSLAYFSQIAFDELKKMSPPKSKSSKEIDQLLGDIRAFAEIGKYYSFKIRAACYLALYEKTADKKYQSLSLENIDKAILFWEKYAKTYDSQYYPALFNRVGFVNMPALLQNAQKDHSIIANWEAKSGKILLKGNTEKAFKE
ncbi:MAG: hypothetical protein KA327_10055 [Pseudarcicella sp.]|nr:hypothetical protein [Pseudarcicella sp.]